MKSIDLNEMEETIRKVISLIDKERNDKNFQNLIKVKLEQSMPLLQKKILRMLIKDTIELSPEIEEKIRLAGLDLNNNGMMFAMLWVINRHAILPNCSNTIPVLLQMSTEILLQIQIHKYAG